MYNKNQKKCAEKKQRKKTFKKIPSELFVENEKKKCNCQQVGN